MDDKELEIIEEEVEEVDDDEESTDGDTAEIVSSIEGSGADSMVDNDIVKEIKDSFLDYSMSVIVARALPDLRDGLKPVHRRILYSMFENGITPDKPHRKSATTVGQVMGTYHPHGDSSIYDALVRMAQPFSYRCPLIDGHGNFGSMDGDGAAAMRYTEARLEKLTLELLRDILNPAGTYSILTSCLPALIFIDISASFIGVISALSPSTQAYQPSE